MSPNLVIVKNAASNIVRGCAGAVVALILPHFLTRTLPPEKYGAWALILQLSAYVGYFDFGLQTAISRFVAHATESTDGVKRNAIVSTAALMLTAAAILALIATVVAAILLPNIFSHVNPHLAPEMRVALVLVAGTMAIGLPASVFHGVFAGLQRNELSALVISASRLASALAVIVATRYSGSLGVLGIVTACVNVAGYVAAYALYRFTVRDIAFNCWRFSMAALSELGTYCFSLTIWSASMLLISGLDLVLVGVFDYPAVAYYSVASSFVVFLAGLQNAVFSALMPRAAILDARGSGEALGQLLIASTRYSTLLLLGTAIPLILGGKFLLTVWLGPTYAHHATSLLQLLILGNTIRLTVTPYAVLLIGTGQQRLVTVSPLVEGSINVAASILCARWLGAPGVAIGTLIGAIFCVLANYVYNMPRTASIEFQFRDYFRNGIAIPAASVLLLTGSALLVFVHGTVPIAAGLLFALVVYLTWRIALLEEERKLCKKALSLLAFTA